MLKRDNIIRIVFWAVWMAVVAVCAFFIVHRACWFIGDDAMVIKHTGFGKPFFPSDTVTPSNGRFFPFAYLLYNILLPFSDGLVSAQIHYSLHAVCFVVFSLCMTCCCLKVLDSCHSVLLRYCITLLFSIICIGRALTQYMECYSTLWFDYLLIAVFLWAIISHYQTQRWLTVFLAIASISVFVFCLEVNFSIPLAFGGIGLLFMKKKKTDFVLFFGCLFSAVLFLILYGTMILPKIDSVYNPSHGLQVGFLKNAIKMFWAQKILVVASLMGIIRLFHLIKENLRLNVFDNLFVAAISFFCCGCILRLNWTLYFNISALLVMPSLLFYLTLYLKSHYTVALLLSLAILYGIKIPKTIIRNQTHRELVNKELTSLISEINEGHELVWYSPDMNDSYDALMRDWRRNSLSSNVGWLINDPTYSIPVSSVFENDNRIWLTSDENFKLFPDDKCLENNSKLVFHADCIWGYMPKEKEQL